MEIHTIGFTQKSASTFFGLLKNAGIDRLVDVRLNNVSQLAGFTKRDDLAYFVRELCDADYRHEPLLAPTDELLGSYRKGRMTWADYERRFLELLDERHVAERLPRSLFDRTSVLLCSEPTAARCHRRLVAEYLASSWGDMLITHL